ncbi:iron chaperone [Pelagibacterium sp.]|uniref:iron chaperone n=1 Tax=Pelagibacterium sp. TaxID=1967288 RepID=UPI003A934DBB
MTKIVDHDAYIAAAPEALRPLLALLRARLAQALPDLEEVIKYDMPGFGAEGLVVAGYAAFSKQCGLYVSKSAIESHAEAIAAAGLKPTKTGVTFSAAKPIPEDLIVALAIASRRALGV